MVIDTALVVVNPTTNEPLPLLRNKLSHSITISENKTYVINSPTQLLLVKIKPT